MEIFAWELALLSAGVVVAEGFFSWLEATFWFGQEFGQRNLKLPFLLHGGVVVGDLILLPYAFFIWVLYLNVPIWLWITFLVVSLIITWFRHRGWWRASEDEPGFMYPNRFKSWGNENVWYRDLPTSGWIHFIYMVWALMLIFGYVYTPMNAEIVWRTFWISVIFVPIAVIEPGIVSAWPPTKKSLIFSFGIATVLWAIVGLVTWIKLHHFFGL